MYQIDNSTAVGTLPAPNAVGPVPGGFFSGGVPGVTDGTIVDPDWLNAVQQESVNVVLGAGLVPSKTNDAQMAAAIAFSSSPVGTMTNAKMTVLSVSANAAFTADEIVLGAALGGVSWKIGNFNQNINLGTVGAGGMDVGAAPHNGYVGLYAILNPATGAQSILATNAATALPSVYSGAAMPADYVASALIGVWPTNASGQFQIGMQRGRKIFLNNAIVLGPTPTTQSSPTAIVIPVPVNATKCSGLLVIGNTTGAQTTINLFPETLVQIYGQQFGFSASGQFNVQENFNDQPIAVAQTIYYTALSSGGTPSFEILITGYEI